MVLGTVCLSAVSKRLLNMPYTNGVVDGILRPQRGIDASFIGQGSRSQSRFALNLELTTFKLCKQPSW